MHVSQTNITNTDNTSVRNYKTLWSVYHDMEANLIDCKSNSTAFVGMFALAMRAKVSLFRGT